MLTIKEKVKAAGSRVRVKRLIQDELFTDTVGTKKGGNILCRWSYFYTHGATAEDYVLKVKGLLDQHNISYRIADSGNNWKAFRGGASVANQSHFFVEIEIENG